MAKVCIICEKEVQHGHAVQDDFVIRAIRKVKQRLNMARNNVLVVEEGCLEEYRKRRAKYERDVVIRVVFAAIILLVFVLLPIFTTGFSVWATLLGLVLAGMFMALSLFSHFPKIAEQKAAAQVAAKTAVLQSKTAPISARGRNRGAAGTKKRK